MHPLEHPMSDERESRVGSQNGPYRVRRLLGKGGMGEVYEAENTIKDRIVALKLLPESASRPGVPQAIAARGAFRGSAAPRRQAREHHRRPRLPYLVDFGIANAA